MKLKLSKDFKEFIESLNAREVEYLVVGGYAVNAHGYPRYTKDIDFWIWLSTENIQRILAVLQDFGMGSLGLTAEDFSNPKNIVQLGYEPLRIDLIMEIEGVDFQDCYANREVVTLSETPVNFIGVKDLIIAKENAARPQDLADAHELRRIIGDLD